MAESNEQQQKNLSKEVDTLKKEVLALKEQLDPYKLAPRVMDIAIQNRGDTTGYIDATYTLKCDVMLQLEWQGRRYYLPAFEL